jgi:hypothetical protein
MLPLELIFQHSANGGGSFRWRDVFGPEMKRSRVLALLLTNVLVRKLGSEATGPRNGPQ